MRLTLALLAAAVTAVAAESHNHNHQHLHKDKRAPVPDYTETTVVPGPTVIAYVLNGHPISAAEVEEGINNGTLVWANTGLEEVSSASSVWSTPTSTSTPTPTAPTTTWSAPTTTTTQAAPTTTAASSSSSSGSSDTDYSSDSSTGIDTPFPNGQISCDTFPDQYGAVSVPWLGLGGWTGIQTPGSDDGGFSDISTATSGSSCTEGSYCSYACPAGYQKTQWPSTQGSTGQSVGGLLCSGGTLQLTNSALSSNLCMQGASEVLVLIENNLGDNVAVCRTDYPGTESETVPLNAVAGATVNLTCPDAANYYSWEGAHTSAQYYVNPSGVSVQDGCDWGSSANPWGNYAPLNLGVGYSDGAAWLAIFQNSPTTSAQLDFSVEITGDGLSGTCRYSGGQYCGGANYDECSSTTGCTVSLSSGTATFVFSSS